MAVIPIMNPRRLTQTLALWTTTLRLHRRTVRLNPSTPVLASA